MDSEVTYTAGGINPPSTKLDYSGIWKVSSEGCTISGTTDSGFDPTEKAPTITAGLCSDETEVSFSHDSICGSRASHSFGVLGDLVKFAGKFGAFSRSWTSQISFLIFCMKMVKYHQIYALLLQVPPINLANRICGFLRHLN